MSTKTTTTCDVCGECHVSSVAWWRVQTVVHGTCFIPSNLPPEKKVWDLCSDACFWQYAQRFAPKAEEPRELTSKDLQETLYNLAQAQHPVGHPLYFANWKDGKPVPAEWDAPKGEEKG